MIIAYTLGMPRSHYPFYVYEITDQSGAVIYVGKGSGRRMAASRRDRSGAGCHEVARFKREADAYAHEVERIASHSGLLNKHKGGNGSKATPALRHRKQAWEKEIERIGTRAYAARILLRYAYMFAPSKVEEFRRVAYG